MLSTGREGSSKRFRKLTLQFRAPLVKVRGAFVRQLCRIVTKQIFSLNPVAESLLSLLVYRCL